MSTFRIKHIGRWEKPPRPAAGSGRFFLASLFFLLPVLLSGCGQKSLLYPDNYMFEQAEREFQQGRFERALGMYRSLQDRESQEFRLDTIHFRIGECFLNMANPSPADARLAFIQLRDLRPESEYVIDVDNRLYELAYRGERMLSMRRQLKAEAQDRLREARRELSAMQSQGIEDDRLSARWLVQAAEALWDLERYEDARDAYVAAINLLPEVRLSPTVQGRLIFPPESTTTPIIGWLMGRQERPEPLDPAKVIPTTPMGELRWPGGKDPLIIYNTTLRYERDRDHPRVRYAVVTGQVKNDSDYVVNRATVEVTLTNVRDQILGVSSSQLLPRLDSKATAAFRVRLGPFDDYENISSYSTRVLLSPEDIER